MDKPWTAGAGRGAGEGPSWLSRRDWAPPAGWDAAGGAWSVAWGAAMGAGSVLLVAAVLLLWRRPKKCELPFLAPMDATRTSDTPGGGGGGCSPVEPRNKCCIDQRPRPRPAARPPKDADDAQRTS
ncbi:unnamed protein product [Plutella xylostella]|uniref:(diamondback moth) hypothetical protein n=1 Tax=Plutella xylostella TaxID=51655 RepID=A0A8S4D4N9_PLUXY|nr:unnamed protein product [Plutella xylostella]